MHGTWDDMSYAIYFNWVNLKNIYLLIDSNYGVCYIIIIIIIIYIYIYIFIYIYIYISLLTNRFGFIIIRGGQNLCNKRRSPFDILLSIDH